MNLKIFTIPVNKFAHFSLISRIYLLHELNVFELKIGKFYLYFEIET